MKKWVGVIAIFLCVAVLSTALGEDETYFLSYGSVIDATYSDLGASDDGGYDAYYENVAREDFDTYIAALRTLHFIPYPFDYQGLECYYVYNLELISGAVFVYDKDNQTLVIATDKNVVPIEAYDETRQAIAENDGISLTVPSDAKGIVLPQFYAFVNSQEDIGKQGQAQADSLFDGQKCWEEHYSNITPKIFDQYLLIMYALGCDLMGNHVGFDDDHAVHVIRIDLVQDDITLVKLTYYPQDSSAFVNYNPNVSFDLQNEEQMIAMIQR